LLPKLWSLAPSSKKPSQVACEERDTHEVEFLEMVRVADQEIKKEKKGDDINLLQCFLPERVIFQSLRSVQYFRW